MKNVLILLLATLLVTPTFADHHRLRGPSKIKSKRMVHVNIRHHRYACHNRRYDSYRTRINNKKLYLVRRQPRKIVVVMQPTRKFVSRSQQKLLITPLPQHRTIIVSPRPKILLYQMKTRNQILAESRAKVRS